MLDYPYRLFLFSVPYLSSAERLRTVWASSLHEWSACLGKITAQRLPLSQRCTTAAKVGYQGQGELKGSSAPSLPH